MKNTRPKVLLVPADFHHAEAYIALNVAKYCSQIDFYFFAAHDIPKKPDDFNALMNSVDIVHFLMNLSNINFPERIDFNAQPCISIATVHHICEGEEIKLTEAKRADYIHTVSLEWDEILQKEYGSATILAHLGVDLAKFKENRTKRPHPIFKIGMFGFFNALHNRKRIDVAIQGYKLLKEKNIPFQVIFQGSLSQEIQDDLILHEIPFEYVGLSDSLTAYKRYKEVDCYVITADVEGGPFSVLEAMASGVPIISTPVGLSIEVINDTNGIIIPKDDPSALAEAVVKIQSDKALYQTMVRNGYETVAHYDWRTICDEYLLLYQHTLSDSTKKNPAALQFKKSPLEQQKEAVNRGLLREIVKLVKFKKHRQAFQLFLKVIGSGYFEWDVYFNFLKKLKSELIRKPKVKK